MGARNFRKFLAKNLAKIFCASGGGGLGRAMFPPFPSVTNGPDCAMEGPFAFSISGADA